MIPISFDDPDFIIHIETTDGKARSFNYAELYELCNEIRQFVNILAR